MSGTQMQHAKEANADIMRQKQAAGMSNHPDFYDKPTIMTTSHRYIRQNHRTNWGNYSRGPQSRRGQEIDGTMLAVRTLPTLAEMALQQEMGTNASAMPGGMFGVKTGLEE
jgi:hypothetical protein